jgi:hypothetical protein
MASWIRRSDHPGDQEGGGRLRYEPKNQYQGVSAVGFKSCGAFSFAVCTDAASLGGCIPTGLQVRALTDEAVPDPGDPGLTILQLIRAVARYGMVMEDRSGQPWASVMADLRAERYLSVSTWYALLRPYTSQASADFGHQVTVGRLDQTGSSVMLYDPLSKSRQGRWLPLATLRGAMEEWGRRTGIPGRVRYARTRRIPFLAE